MRFFPSLLRTLVFGGSAVLALSLAGCARHHAAPPPQADTTPGTVGSYKVGKAYQVNGVWYYPAEDFNYDDTGIASWYGPGFVGNTTANGEPYDEMELTAAHKTLPMPSIVQVTNLENGRTIKLRINDRGPYHPGRIIDVSRRAAQLLGFEGQGTAKVRVKIIPEESQAIAAGARVRTGAIAVASTDGAGATEASYSAQTAKSDDGTPAPLAAPRMAVEVEGSGAPPPPPPPPEAEMSPIESPGDNAPGHVVAGRFLPAPVVSQAPVTSGHQIYIQAGAFSQGENAYKLQARMKSFGPSGVTVFQTGGARFYRVRIGPLATEDQADALLSKVIAAGVNGARVVVD